MIEVKFGSWQPPSTILTGVVVTRVNIEAGETHVALRHPLIGDKE
jgi:hypothetical protein